MNAVAIVLLRALAHLPLGLLYSVSTVLHVVLRDVIGYRKRVIIQNLQRAFPDRSTAEVKAIARSYYQYLADLIVESIYLHAMTAEELRAHVVFENPELLYALEADGKRGMIMMGHSGNWEWAGLATAERFSFTLLPIYRKIKNDAMDDFMRKLRSRFSSHPVHDKEAFDAAVKHPLPHTFAVLADQTPSGKKGWWLKFLNQETPFYRGGEVLAERFGYEVVFAHVLRAGRGQYRIHLERFHEPANNDRGAMTKAFASFLEEHIRQQPENWLWSHKRWKHQANEQSVWIDRG